MPDDESPDESTPPEREREGEGTDAATAPGEAVGEGHGALDGAPEPNEPA